VQAVGSPRSPIPSNPFGIPIYCRPIPLRSGSSAKAAPRAVRGQIPSDLGTEKAQLPERIALQGLTDYRSFQAMPSLGAATLNADEKHPYLSRLDIRSRCGSPILTSSGVWIAPARAGSCPGRIRANLGG
jgi:hypothetical protein